MKKSEQNDLARVMHIREAAQKALRAVSGKTRQSLDQDETLELALVAALAIMGEAASNVTEAYREAHPQIPWELMIGTRHRVVHAYYEVDRDIIWDTVTKNIPTLLRQIDDLIPPDDESA